MAHKELYEWLMNKQFIITINSRLSLNVSPKLNVRDLTQGKPATTLRKHTDKV